MPSLSVELRPRSKSAFGFDVRAAGPVSVEVQWSGTAKLSGFLYGPNSKVAYDRKTGAASPLTLSATATQAMVAQKSMWVAQVYNPTDAPLRATLSVKFPRDIALRPLDRQDQDLQQPRAVALFAHLLTRYVNNAPVESRADRALKEALDKLPNSRNVLGRAVNAWRAIPAPRRQAIFGAEFGDLAVRAAIPEEKLALNLRTMTDVGLVNFTPGLRVRKEARELSVGVPTPSVSLDIPPSQFQSLTLPTYRIDFAGIYCQKETKIDGASSEDEPYVIFAATDGFKTWSKRSDIFPDVDTGNARAPLPAFLSLFGETGPEPSRDLAIITTVMDHDQGDPDHYRNVIHGFVEAGRALAAAYGYPVPEFVSNLVGDAINWFVDTGDDKIGTQSVVFEAGAFHSLALSPQKSFKGLSYNILSPIHTGDEWWNGAKYNVMYNIRHDPPFVPPTQRWSDWEFLGGEFQGAPAVSSWGDNRLDVFVGGTNKHMMHKWWDGSEWSGWEDLGGKVNQGPGAVSWGPNRIDCFTLGKGLELSHRWYASQWSDDWEPLGGIFQFAPAVSSWGENRLDVFVRGTNTHMLHRWWEPSGGWSGWEDLGGEIKDAPATVSWGHNRIDCFARGMDDQLYHKAWQPGWSDWLLLGGVFQGAPTVSSWGDNRLDVFVRGTNNHLMHKWWDGSAWSGWEDLGGELNSGPGAVSWGPNRIDCFVRGTDNQLWHKWTWLE